MAFENLSDREKQILNNLINYYISTADPVGSRVIANKFSMGISSATIRNTLQDLEELGLLQQPHVSAGRIPTDLGYRVYVDYLLKPDELTDQEKLYIKNSLMQSGAGINEILGQTCKVLSDITDQLGVTIAPRFEEGVLKQINLIPLMSDRVMVVVVVQSGLASSMIMEVEANISKQELRKVEEILNERLVGLTLGKIRSTISKRLADVSGEGKLLKLMIDSRDNIWSENQSGNIHVAGAGHLVNQPEFADPNRTSRLIQLLENETALADLFNDAIRQGLVITIGEENKIQEIINCSMVTSQYKAGKVVGTIGIVGPTRMEYAKLVSVVQYTARTLSEILTKSENKE